MTVKNSWQYSNCWTWRRTTGV